MKYLGQYLLDMGSITDDLLQSSLTIQKKSGKRLGEILLERGGVTSVALELALATQRQDEQRNRGFAAAILRVRALANTCALPGGLVTLCVATGLLAGALSFPIVFYFFSGWAWSLVGMTDDQSKIITISAAAIVLILIAVCMEAFVSYLSLTITANLLRSLATRVHENVVNRAFHRIDQKTSDSVLGVYTQSLEQFAINIEEFMVRCPKSVSTLVIFFTLFFVNDWVIASLTLVLAILTLLVPPQIASRATSFFTREPAIMGEVMNKIEPFFVHFRTTGGVLLGRSVTLVKRFLEAHHLNQANKWFYWNTSFNVKTLLNLLTMSVILIYGGYNVLEGEMDIPTLFSLFLAVSLILPRFDDVYQSYFFIVSAGHNAVTLNEQLRLPVLERSDRGLHTPLRLTGLDVDVDEFTVEKTCILRKVHCRFQPGRLYLVVGESGSGKSTLARIIAGLYQADSARVTLHYESDVEQNEPLGHVAYIGQEHAFLERLDLAGNIAFDAGLSDAQREAIRADIERFGVNLSAKTDDGDLSLNEQFSGGEKQRLHVLQGLYAPQKIKIFDEPTSSLDATTADIIKHQLAEVPDHEIRLVITHDPNWPVPPDRIVRLTPVAEETC